MAHLLFIYGTLSQTDNPVAHLLQNRLRYLFKGKIKGVLYDTGDYPGLIPDDKGNWVYGSICELDDDALAIIDDYEGYGENQEQPNLYLRLMSAVQTESSIISAWIYVYNRSVDGFEKIQSGNYQEYLQQKKSP
ncbi:gamma-glutamylcyclotransferase family protein [Mucilaginibacter glaciei]|uniref:Gamma-glutamylcyclotransferase n=1 Tax=Mucilaginibacter glaciei TaxID=2772109 RepID=A0A926NQF4_9SPHI|nr:gamma-glutamylcyclotransferase family protein [Mucilaginibacter glaciei]MBD1391980.1 gamma-glutamylcyclotransferase [Mucilaginibacter glaciei]